MNPEKYNWCNIHIYGFTYIYGFRYKNITPNVMNDYNKISSLTPNINLYEYGLSTLHARIRYLECILHISYRLILKKWKIISSDRPLFEERKARIINDLKEEMHIIVDTPTSVSGTTNDDNTARRFLANLAWHRR